MNILKGVMVIIILSFGFSAFAAKNVGSLVKGTKAVKSGSIKAKVNESGLD